MIFPLFYIVTKHNTNDLNMIYDVQMLELYLYHASTPLHLSKKLQQDSFTILQTKLQTANCQCMDHECFN